MKKGILITTEVNVKIKEYCDPLYKTVGYDVGGLIEIVHPRGLPEPYIMIVNEEGLYTCPEFNPFGSVLYGGTIMGDIVLMKDGLDEKGDYDIVGLDDEDIRFLDEEFFGGELQGNV